MTKEEKQERRAVRHKLQNAATKRLSPAVKMYSTAKQLRAHGRKIADQLFAGKNPGLAVAVNN